jgi:hypothetical protein
MKYEMVSLIADVSLALSFVVARDLDAKIERLLETAAK